MLMAVALGGLYAAQWPPTDFVVRYRVSHGSKRGILYVAWAKDHPEVKFLPAGRNPNDLSVTCELFEQSTANSRVSSTNFALGGYGAFHVDEKGLTVANLRTAIKRGCDAITAEEAAIRAKEATEQAH